MTVSAIYILGAILLYIASAFFFIVSIVKLHSYTRIYHVMLSVPLIAATAYLVMSNDIGIFLVDGTQVNVTRYIDWLITTPILLYILTYTMYKGRNALQRQNFLLISGLDILMLLTGLGAELTDGNLHIVLFSTSTICFLAMLYLVVDGMLSLHTREENQSLKYITLLMAWTILALWSIYPFIWIFSPHGFSILSEVGVAVSFIILDLTTKTGFAALFLFYLANKENSNLNPQ